MEAVLKSPNKGNTGLNGFTTKVYQTFKEHLRDKKKIKLFQRVEVEGTLTNSFYEAIISWYQN